MRQQMYWIECLLRIARTRGYLRASDHKTDVYTDLSKGDAAYMARKNLIEFTAHDEDGREIWTLTEERNG